MKKKTNKTKKIKIINLFVNYSKNITLGKYIDIYS